uniref:Cobyric acid synthase n=1 Tax=Candidatus Kentrum sp. UNK TaxID=2126344 RepID=A0A451A2J1_9GAMM|nr:MAG: L-threonine O-3-phosphate decarboxylase /adenosylcobyric acid synthase (glutamine-hydrolysing) [Candidatus Kentron sp. UNK]VFK68401.1 MAG: L-threonine O-3-phosphate decarboxylase /adenosylcobyric acid synthase (glutamine-hydrolysing) [Candidatus Kentron sp. UNK]
MKSEHGGDVRNLARLAGCEVEELIDFSANINPLGPPDSLRPVIARHLGALTQYPDPHCQSLREAIASVFSLSATQVVCGNGSTELLYALPWAFSRAPREEPYIDRAVIPVPSYIDYATAATRAGLEVTSVPSDIVIGFSVNWRRVERELTGHEMVIVGQPGNPSGALFDPNELLAVSDRHPSSLFVVDEAFADFVAGYKSLARYERPNIIVLRSATKFYGIPGLRLGYALASNRIAQRLSDALPPWSVGSLAQAVGAAVLKDHAYAEKTRAEVARLRERLHGDLLDLGSDITVFPSVANYLLARLDGANPDATTLARRLLTHRIAIRVCDNYRGLDDKNNDEPANTRYFRVAVRAEEENARLIHGLSRALEPSPRRKGRVRTTAKPRPPAIMFQGTSSNAGKSVLASAFCRILLQDGYRVAPFKAQNMSLNSYVTRAGGEMGRAQVVQAQACRLDPDTRMNPVLLKPNSEIGSQVILQGKPVGNMNVSNYIQYKKQAFSVVKEAYDALSSEVDAMVIEGAGSPGEVNLKQHDIVNMGMAAHARAPVLIVGDIDRGGVFASFVGTMEVLGERERALVAGFIINRFRGQRALLAGAMEYVRDYTGVPTLGIIPYLRDLDLPEEDSVSFKARDKDAPRGADQVEIAVIDVPHISNFTDFDPLELEPDVCLRIIRKAHRLGSPDAVILPGSKNAPSDLAYLRTSGLAEAILALARKGTAIVGVCAGMQMLGREIADPHGIESHGFGSGIEGLGLLALRTVLASDKTLKIVSARHTESGLAVKGYEIHHGYTSDKNLRAAMVTDDGNAIGFASEDGNISGTYLHGLYDNDAFRRRFIDRLRARRGLAPIGAVQVTYDLEPALDRLALVARENMDVEGIYRKMGLK